MNREASQTTTPGRRRTDASAVTRKEAVRQADLSLDTPVVSVVIPVLNEERDIGRLLSDIIEQQSPPGGFEILVADGGSTDRTRHIVSRHAERHENVQLLDNPGRLSSAGRNVGAHAARGKYVVFVDGHSVIPRPDYLIRLVEIFESTDAACLCRPQPLTNLRAGGWGSAIALARHSPIGHNPGSDIYSDTPAKTDPRSAGAAYVRTTFLELGGYDERFDACEDVEFNHRVFTANLTAYRHPDLSIDYRPRSSLLGLFHQMVRYGRGRARLMARHPRLVPWVLMAASLIVVTTCAFAVTSGMAAVVLGGAAVAYGVILAVESIRIGGFRWATLRVPVAFALIHSGLVLGLWRGLLEYGRFRQPKPRRVQVSAAT